MKSVTERDSPLGDESLFIFSILVVGLSGLVAQVLVLRELLVSFYGNELTLGLIFANWIISEALGVFIIGRFIDRIKNKVNIFTILQILFSLILPLSIYLSRAFKSILGIPFGEGIGLSTVFYSSFLIILPLAFCHGALFSCSCKVYSLYPQEEAAHSIGRIYTWEIIGTIIGGIVLTYVFIPQLNSFQIAFIVSLSNLIICLFFFRHTLKALKYIVLSLLILAGFLSMIGGVNNLQRISIRRQWQAQNILDYRNSIYGNIVVTRKEKQQTFFYNGIPIITTPYPDITFVQEFGNLPLLFHPYPEDILVISAGAGGLINEILKHPVRKVDYAELDPLIIEMLKKHSSALTRKELTDQRVNVINQDGRFFARTTRNRYDVILIGLSKPADLSANRLFTQEFFSLLKKRLHSDGILAFYLPGSLTYLSSELRDLNACILNGLKNAYGYVRIIPGDYNIFLASQSGGILTVSPNLITRRINQYQIKTDILVPAYLDYRLDKSWLDWFMQSSRSATKKINRDFMPTAAYQMLVLWNKQFSLKVTYILERLGNLNLKVIAVLVSLITAVFFLIFHYKYNLTKLSIAYSIATTGFFGMLMNLVLIFSFQVVYGYLYHKIGLLISIFMAGIALGSILITHNIEKIKNSLSLLVKLEVAIALFSYISAVIISRLTPDVPLSSLIFILLFFISGLFMGLEFPLASKIYLKEKEEVGRVAGLLYFSDLVGGCIAAILGGVVFLPILGLFHTCMVIILVKLSSLMLLGIFGKRLTKAII